MSTDSRRTLFSTLCHNPATLCHNPADLHPVSHDACHGEFSASECCPSRQKHASLLKADTFSSAAAFAILHYDPQTVSRALWRPSSPKTTTSRRSCTLTVWPSLRSQRITMRPAPATRRIWSTRKPVFAIGHHSGFAPLPISGNNYQTSKVQVVVWNTCYFWVLPCRALGFCTAPDSFAIYGVVGRPEFFYTRVLFGEG